MAEQFEIVITQKAEISLEQIVLYLEEEVSFSTAEKIRISLLELIASLAKHPEANSILQEISDDKITFRRAIKWSYRVIYYIDKDQDLIYVLDVDHVRRNPDKLKEILK